MNAVVMFTASRENKELLIVTAAGWGLAVGASCHVTCPRDSLCLCEDGSRYSVRVRFRVTFRVRVRVMVSFRVWSRVMVIVTVTVVYRLCLWLTVNVTSAYYERMVL